MAKFLAGETRGWYCGEHGETLTQAQYDWTYNEATDALIALGNATRQAHGRSRCARYRQMSERIRSSDAYVLSPSEGFPGGIAPHR
jgi:hypothetical protein